MIKGMPALQARLRAISQTEQMLRDIQIRGVAEAKHLVPRRTGNLGRTIRVGPISDERCSIVAGGTRLVGYAIAVERGTRARTILPRNARVLAWGGSRRLSGTLRSGAKPTNFAMSVHHPGQKAKPYLVPGLRKAAESQGVTSLVEVWNKAG